MTKMGVLAIGDKLLKGISRPLGSEAPKELAEINHTGAVITARAERLQALGQILGRNCIAH